MPSLASFRLLHLSAFENVSNVTKTKFQKRLVEYFWSEYFLYCLWRGGTPPAHTHTHTHTRLRETSRSCSLWTFFYAYFRRIVTWCGEHLTWMKVLHFFWKIWNFPSRDRPVPGQRNGCYSRPILCIGHNSGYSMSCGLKIAGKYTILGLQSGQTPTHNSLFTTKYGHSTLFWALLAF